MVDAIQKQGFSYVYLHIDVDVLDPISFPLIKEISEYPTPDGIDMETLWQIHHIITHRLSTIGWSLVEAIPPLEVKTHLLEQLATFYAQALKQGERVRLKS